MSLLQTSLILPKLRITTTSFNPRHRRSAARKPFPPLTLSLKPDPSEPEPGPAKPKPKRRPSKPILSQSDAGKKSPPAEFPEMIPRKPRRGRRSEAQAVEDHVRATLGRTFASIREQNPEMFENVPNMFRERKLDEGDDDDDDDDEHGARVESEMVVEEESQDWPLDTDVGWGIRASEFFEKHPIKNVVGEDGFEIDWEGEIDDSWVKEINCLEWESFAYHPSPLVVLVFERYKSSAENWKTLKELEEALKVYWDAKDRLPPRSVKLDINIEKDLAYALKVKEGPQILFLRGQTILYREKEFRTADQLVHLIAHFYYNAKCPSWVDKSALAKRY